MMFPILGFVVTLILFVLTVQFETLLILTGPAVLGGGLSWLLLRARRDSPAVRATWTVLGAPLRTLGLMVVLVPAVVLTCEGVVFRIMGHFWPPVVDHVLPWWEAGSDISVNVEGVTALVSSAVAVLCRDVALNGRGPARFQRWLRPRRLAFGAAWCLAMVLIMAQVVLG